MKQPKKQRLATIAAIDAYVAHRYVSPEVETDTEQAILDLVCDLFDLANDYQEEGVVEVGGAGILALLNSAFSLFQNNVES